MRRTWVGFWSVFKRCAATSLVLEKLGSARLLDNDDRIFLCYSGGRASLYSPQREVPAHVSFCCSN